MALPNHQNAVVDEEKLTGYLLSETHPLGRFKAQVFARLGYTLESWRELRADLLAAVALEEPVSQDVTPYGVKYQVPCTPDGPSGESVVLTTVWVIRTAEDFPRFVTAYPAGA